MPVRGGLAGLAAGAGDGGYWQLAPRSGDGLNAGIAGTEPASEDASVLEVLEVLEVLDVPELLDAGAVDVEALLVLCSLLLVTRAITETVMAATATMAPRTMSVIRRLLAC